MKKVINLSIVLVLLSFIFSGCEKGIFAIKGEGDVVSQTIVVSEFEKAEFAGEFDVEVSYGDTVKVVAEGQQNIIDRLDISNNSGKLKIKLQRGNYRNFQLKIVITTPNIEEVDLSGSGDIIVNKFDDLNDLKFSVSGSGNIISTDYVNADNLSFDISGSGNIDFMTNSNFVSTDISGSGKTQLS